MKCLEKIKHEVLSDGASFEEAKEFIEKYSDEIYYVEPGYKILGDCYLIGVGPIALGIKGSDLIFPIVKPHLGTFVAKAKAEQEIKRLRERETSSNNEIEF
ncbi:MAG: DUF1894 domain-containing protein [Methanotrichaceae archaeon]|nr:DUF1894 domain-containing protein [Methanotrichaceae archaeon]